MLPEEAYVTHKEKLVASLTRYSGDREAAADAVQEAFVRALVIRERVLLMNETAFVSWLYVTAKNALIDVKRRDSRMVPSEDADELWEDDDPDNAILSGEFLSKLPEELRQAVILRYYSGFNSTEIGRMLSLSPATVRTRLRAAISIMKSYIKEE